MKLQDGTVITDLTEPIFSALKDKNDVILMLPDDFEEFIEQNKKKGSFGNARKSNSPIK